MKKKVYILSGTWDYARNIASDAGPAYAQNMGWEFDTLDHIGRHTDCINILDNFVSEAEGPALEAHIARNPDTLFLLTIVDAYYRVARKRWIYRFLNQVKDRRNVFFLSKYLPAEFVEELDQATHRRKMVFVPFPFVDRYHTDRPLASRIRKISFSGFVNKEVYPLRTRFLRAVTWNPLLWGQVAKLPHPGYDRSSKTLTHDLIGPRYIEYLSRYVFMLNVPSRSGRLEFLKYGECAYARCVPVGKTPESFTARMRAPFVELDFDHLHRSIRRLFSMPDSELAARAQDYYAAMEADRNPAVLNARLDGFLEDKASFLL
jgi:hypothetical protein